MKKESIYLVLAFFILCAHSLYANKSVRLASPNGKIKFSLVLDKNSPVYSVAFNKQTLIQDSPLTLTFDNGAFGENVKINKPVFSTKEETYELIVGKAKHIHSLSKEVIIPLEETVQPFRKINLVVRALMTVSPSAMSFRSKKDGIRISCMTREPPSTYKVTRT